MKRMKKRKCIVCEKIFNYNSISTHKRSSSKLVRGKNMITCSSKCSRIYARVSRKSNYLMKEKFAKVNTSEKK